MSHPKNQHYVPRFLLRSFLYDDSSLFVFDKVSVNHYKSSINDISSEKYFYDIEPGNPENSFEYLFQKIEDECAPIIKNIILNETIRFLTEENKYWLAAFISSQYLRTKGMRVDIKKIAGDMEKVYKRLGVYESQKNRIDRLSSEEGSKKQSLINLNSIETFIPYIINKKWILFKSDNRFVISDNPVTLNNNIPEGNSSCGNLGFGVKGIEINLPLSPSIVLVLFDIELFDEYEKYYERHYKELQLKGLYNLQNFVISCKRKLPFVCLDRHIEAMNYMQFEYSERQLYSNSIESFNLFYHIENAGYKVERPRMKMS